MIRNINIYIAVVAALLLVGCGSEELPLTHADGYGEVSFNVGGEGTRANERTYVGYDYDRDPHFMGVFGWYNLLQATSLSDNKMFDNLELTATPDKETQLIAWDYEPKRYWSEFADFVRFDNFAYMPYNPGATLTRDANVYTLSMPVNFGPGTPFSVTETALMCNLPDYKADPDGVIMFKMDQALTGYKLVFQLGDKMSDIRYFVIKSVKVYGQNFVSSGTVSRQYTLDPENSTTPWTSGDFVWDLNDDEEDRFDVLPANAVPIPYNDNSADAPVGEDWTEYYSQLTEKLTEEKDTTYGVLRVNKVAVPWGKPIYLFPARDFNPVFEVTYDAVVVNEDGDDVVTRKNVVSTIEFSEDYFEKLKTAGATEMGKARTIHVKIVPDHLYVLADADQTFGYIPVP